jgi:iron complex transport system substrate-binding protein
MIRWKSTDPTTLDIQPGVELIISAVHRRDAQMKSDCAHPEHIDCFSWRHWIVLLLLLVSPACQQESTRLKPDVAYQAQSATETITVTDLAGRDVTLKQPIERIVLMRSLGVYDLAAILGDALPETLVGWDSSLKTGDADTYQKFVERFPRLKEVTVLGDVLRDTVSAEAVLALKPDLVIVNTYMLDRGVKTLEQLERAGVPLLYLQFDDPFQDTQNSLRLLGKVLGKEARAEAVVEFIDTEINKVLDRLEQIDSPPPSLYLEAGTQGPTRYGNTFGQTKQGKAVNWGSVLSQVRCRNIAAESIAGMYGMGVIRPEYLLSQDPDVIVISGAHWMAFPDSLQLGYLTEKENARAKLQVFAKRPGWSQLSAIKAHRLHGIHARFGSHALSFVAAQQLARWLYPKEFRDLDPAARLREFHEKFMPVSYSGTWMVSGDVD